MACSPDEPLRGTFVARSPTEVSLLPLGAGTGTAATPILFLNRCAGGCFVEPGRDDSRTNRSSIPAWPVELPEFPWGDDVWQQTLRCVQRLYAPFELTVTDVDPGPLVPHFEEFVAGHAALIGQPGFVGGIAPFACGVVENGVSFTFGGAIGPHPEELCTTIGQESGHAFGLDHERLCDDPMTYLSPCGPKRFQRVDAPCGEEENRPCYCGESFQNSYLTLLAAFGPRREPLLLPPDLRFARPLEGDAVRPRFRVELVAESAAGIAEVTLAVDGETIASSTRAPFVFITPPDLASGERVLSAAARDRDGLVSETRIRVALAPEPDRPDASAPDALTVAVPPPLPARPDGGAELEGQRSPVALGEAGCRCVSSRGRGLDARAALGILAGVWIGRRRRRLAPALALAGMPWLIVAAAGCGGEERVTSQSGILSADPAPGTPLAFVWTLGEALPKAQAVMLSSAGTAPLFLRGVRIEGPDAAHFRFAGGRSELPPGAHTAVVIDLLPTSPLHAEAELIIDTSDRAQPQVRYPLRAEVREPCRLFASPPELDFDAVGERHRFTLTAYGNADCTLRRVSIDERLFELSGHPELPHVLAAGTSIELEVTHVARSARRARPVRELRWEAIGGTAVVRLVGMPPAWGCLESYPAEIDFSEGDRRIERAARALVINTCADEPVDILSVVADQAPFEVAPTALPRRIPPLSQAFFEVRYRPEQELGDTGRLILISTDALSPRLAVGLRGRARLPRPVMPPAIDLGAAVWREAPGDCHSRGVWIPLVNFGEGALLVEDIHFEPGGDQGFELLQVSRGGASVDPAQPILVPAHDALFALVDYRPLDATPGERSSALVVRHSGLQEVSRTELRASTREDAPIVETRVQPGAAPIDVIWAIDDSASMTEPRRRLVAAVPSFLGRAEAADYQSIVVTGDPSWPDGGRPRACLGAPAVLSRAFADASERSRALACAIGSFELIGRTEQAALGAGMRALERAVAPPRTDGVGNPLERLLRPDARLLVITASDEEDQSEESTAVLRGFLAGLKGGRPDLVTVQAIAGASSDGCGGAAPWVQAGLRYRAIAEATGGALWDVCAGRYEPHLDAIGAEIARPVDGYALPVPVDPVGFEVRVGGRVVPDDRLDGFALDLARGVLRLGGASLPAAGEGIEARYAAECRPPMPSAP
ncbi:MAG: hypothetical protein IT384_19810 [Deltaproteobacteria bacterium]|nr:hypothetical protein [Deltaproteobacteria bacterium]